MEDEVRKAFLARPRLVENAPGFCGLEVLTDAKDSSLFLLVTRWTDEESFRTWHGSEAHHESHRLIPKGLKLDASFTSVTIGHDIRDGGGTESLNDVAECRSGAFAQWLIQSDAVFALLFAPDGTIHARNQAAQRIFPPLPQTDENQKIWDYLVPSDVENLRQRLSASASGSDGSFLMNLAHGQQTPVTWEAHLVRCGESILLLGTHEHRHDSQFQDEILGLTNDLSMTIREAARKNRELEQANKTIELLVRTDTLTGLANRRMLEETLPRETARALRLNENLSVIFADLDHFKPINDQFGHNAGDQVLAGLGIVLKSQLRSYALATRFGGDEFVLLLPGTTKDGAVTVAERIREKVAAMTVPECPRQITMSMGVACLESGESGEELVARADEALYRAKGKGGNRVEVA
jgi:diguanylate cyclase (GGDEF)-like protein